MKNLSTTGNIIIINGPSSSGKTTLALVLQKQLDIPFLRFSFDLFLENNALPMDQIKRGAFSWNSMRPSIFNGIHQCVPALAAAGNNLIFDHIIETKSWLDNLVQLLAEGDKVWLDIREHLSLKSSASNKASKSIPKTHPLTIWI